MTVPPQSKRRPGRPRQNGPSPAFLTRQGEIIDAAVDVFRECGFEGGTLDDVAARLGTGRASIYHYVPSKAHLLYLIFDRAISTTLERMDTIAVIEDPVERLQALIANQIRTIAENQSMFVVFFGDRPSLDGEYDRKIRAKERQLLRLLIEAIKDAAANGSLRVDDPRMAGQAILGMTSWFHQWYDPDRDDPERFVYVCQQLLFGD